MKKILLTSMLFATTLAVAAQRYTGQNAPRKEDILNKEYCTGMFKSTDGTILDLTDDNTSAIGYLNILDWMQGRVAGLQVYTSRNGIRIPYIRDSRASIFIDEIPVDASFLNSLSVSDIAIVKVIRGPFAGSIGSNSAVAIYTIQQGEAEEEK